MKLYVLFGQFFLIFSGLTNSFGPGLFVELELIIPDQGMLVRSLGKSIGKIFGGINVILHVIN